MIFSVVIPYYKDYNRLIQLLNQLNRQDLDPNQFEVIVVNNDPEIPLVLPKGLDVRYSLKVIDEQSPGSYAARNKGISEAKGEIIAFTDSDCLPDSAWLKNALLIFEDDEAQELGVLTGPVPLFYKDPQRLTAAEVYEKYTGFTTEAYAKHGHAITANWFSYKNTLFEFGGFNAGLKSNGDTELSGRIGKKYRILYDDTIVVMHPARFEIQEIVQKYRRLIGGVYIRKFQNKPIRFVEHIFDFFFRRLRFALKKFFTVPLSESLPIAWVCFRINMGVLAEYFSLIFGLDTKR
ncbi:glycosyltransferase [Algoriphagus formosus]|uniref:glycosyltransferase n=1 Tax=Algoriphagus formosus TaxID=2007308 RepID=UPI003F7237DC